MSRRCATATCCGPRSCPESRSPWRTCRVDNHCSSIIEPRRRPRCILRPRVAQVYQDPSCPQQPPTYALDFNYTSCASNPSHLFLRGSKLALASYYFKGSDGSCNGPYTSTNEDYYTLGAEVPPSDLVKLTV